MLRYPAPQVSASAAHEAGPALPEPALFDPLTVDLPAADGRFVVVEASAGTGKTYNLTAVVLRLVLEHGVALKHMLVSTYTKAAAAELGTRIRTRLQDTLAYLQHGSPPPDDFTQGLLQALQKQHSAQTLLERLQLALTQFDEATITTLHGFCQRALAESPLAAQQPFATELITDDADLRLQVAQDFWRTTLGGAHVSPALLRGVRDAGDTPEHLARLLSDLSRYPGGQALWPADLNAHTAADAPPNPHALQRTVDAARHIWHSQGADAIDLVLRLPAQTLRKAVTEAVIRTAQHWWQAALAQADVLATPPIKAKPELLTQSGLDAAALSNKTAPQHAVFAALQALWDARQAHAQASARLRLRWLQAFVQAGPGQLLALKDQQRQVSFDDLLPRLDAALRGPGGATLKDRLRQRYRVALIDEFQDTDALQYRVVQRLFSADPGASSGAIPGAQDPAIVVLVGDPKQAIYRFRGADLHTYFQARNAQGQYQQLVANQRSSNAMLAGANALLRHRGGGLIDPQLRLQAATPGAKRPPALVDPRGSHSAAPALHLWGLPVQDNGHPLSGPAALRLACNAVAQDIARALQRPADELPYLQDDTASRKLHGGDVAVLVRSHTHAAQMRDALAALGVPSVLRSQQHLLASTEAVDLLRVLHAWLQPQRDGLVRAALATPFMGWTAQQIHAASWDEAAPAASDAPSAPEPVADIAQRWAQWAADWHGQGPAQALRRWMNHEAVAQRLLALPDGERRLTNLLHLIETLQTQARSHPQPHALLRWLEREHQATRQRDAGRPSDDLQLRLESDAQRVQILTVHASKGLEYPLVYVLSQWTAPSGGRGGATPLLKTLREADGVLHWVIGQKKHPNDAAKQDRIGDQEREARVQEDLRLSYVAITRAVHRCTVVVGPYGATHAKSGVALNWLVCPEFASKDLAAGTVTDAWRAFAPQHPDAIAWRELDVSLQSTPYTVDTPQAATDLIANPLQAKPLGAIQRQPWNWASFTSLMRQAERARAVESPDAARKSGALAEGPAEAPVADHDWPAATASAHADGDIAWPSPTSAVQADASDILHFSRGPEAGVALHRVLELVRWQAPDTWAASIAQALTENPALLADPLQATRLQHLLADLACAPLAGLGAKAPDAPLVMQNIAHADIRTEWPFALGRCQVPLPQLRRVLQGFGYADMALSHHTLDSYWQGSIDALVRQRGPGGRYWVIDWKSNYLGHTAADYEPPALQDAMHNHGYTLQALLYALAVHRHLRLRLGGYSVEQHLGGVLMVFVRGVRAAGHPWAMPADSAAAERRGVVHIQPSAACLQALDDLFTPQRTGVAA